MDEITLTGSVGEVIYRNTSGTYTVISLETDTEIITAVGALTDIYEGEIITAIGVYKQHRTYGKQFSINSYSRALPTDTHQIFKYLSSGAIPGIGAKRALSIIDKFGDDTLEVIENFPEKLASIKGISFNKAEKIAESYKKQADLRNVILKLQKYGITALESARVYKKLGNNAVNIIKENPYSLCSLEVGIGFERAESIERMLEVTLPQNLRIEEGVLYTLRHNLFNNGHTCIPRKSLISRAAAYLLTDNDTVDIAIDSLVDTIRLKSEMISGEEFIFLPSSFRDELGIAKRIMAIMHFPPVTSNTLMSDIEKIEKLDGIVYGDEQKEAIAAAVNKGLLILTGGPGTGKTTTLKGILTLFEKQGLDIQLAAPTGRAAQRMSEITNREAKTIHRLLEVQWNEDDKPVFTRNIQNPLSCNAVVLDELSMVDTSLFAAFLDALPLGCRLVLVGDSDQLPPVGAGNVLKDIIDSKTLPVIKLSTIFRQALESDIVKSSHMIIKGEMPELSNGKDSDFFHIETTSPLKCAETIADLYHRRLPSAYKFDALTDIQVICPSKKGESGTGYINTLLQNKVNPKSKDKKEIVMAGFIFRENDKVMQTRNNYMLEWVKDKEKGEGIFNGDIGILKKIKSADGIMIIDFDGRITEYPLEYLNELELSYAITVHKSQGSEFNAVIIAATGIPQKLSYRNLLYTAVTRAKEICITVGTKETLYGMIGNDKKSRRYSALKHFLTAKSGDEQE